MGDDRSRWLRLPAPGMAARAGLVAVLGAMLVAGCSNAPKPASTVDPNLYPTNYKQQIAEFLTTALVDPADFRLSFIAPPVQVQIGNSQHYVVCVQLNGHNQHKDKVAIYLAGSITQFVDAPEGQCVNAPYEPFKELAAMTPS
jgi:hypothetical protein